MSSSILIVDEDRYLAGIYARRFELAGWKARVAESKEDAEKQLEKGPVDVLLVDTETVEDALTLLKEQASTALCLALTRLGHAEDREAAKKAGAAGYLLKGHFVPSEVVSYVGRLLRAT